VSQAGRVREPAKNCSRTLCWQGGAPWLLPVSATFKQGALMKLYPIAGAASLAMAPPGALGGLVCQHGQIDITPVQPGTPSV
jgi:hypothetical protein